MSGATEKISKTQVVDANASQPVETKEKNLKEKTTSSSSGSTIKKSKDSDVALATTLVEIEKKFGKGTVMVFGQQAKMNVDAVSTGSILLNSALGVGGFPRGRIIEVYGPEASGKTTIALHAIAEVQKMGGTCAFIDAEHALDPVYAKALGVKVEDLLISQPDYGEQALDVAEMLVRSGAIDMIVLDSVAALVPRAEIDGEMGDAHVGLQARLMSQALRKLTPVVNKSKTVLIFINQIRQKINTMAFANNETTSGGNALKFYASVRLDIRRIESIKKSEKHIGNRVVIKVVKNKVSPPFKKAEVDVIFGQGIAKERELVDIALKTGIIRQSGAWFSLGGNKIAQGREALCEKVKNDTALFGDLYKKLVGPNGCLLEVGVTPDEEVEQ